MTIISKMDTLNASFTLYKDIEETKEKNRRYNDLISAINAMDTVPTLQNLVDGIIVVEPQSEIIAVWEKLCVLKNTLSSLGLEQLDISGDVKNTQKVLDSIKTQVRDLHTAACTRFQSLQDDHTKLHYGKTFTHDALSIPIQELTEKGKILRTDVCQKKTKHDQFVGNYNKMLPTDKIAFNTHKENALQLYNLCIALAQEKEGDKTQEKIDMAFATIASQGITVGSFLELWNFLEKNNRTKEMDILRSYKVVKR